MKAVVAAFNQEKALVGAFSVITNFRMDLFEALVMTLHPCASVVWEPGDQVDATVSAPFIVTRISIWVTAQPDLFLAFPGAGVLWIPRNLGCAHVDTGQWNLSFAMEWKLI